MTSPSTPTRPYHHGDLRNALVEAGVELAREGGPTAIVLRAAARRVGVSPNAAYRHFADLPDLVAAVADRSLEGLAASMLAELEAWTPSGDVKVDAWARMRTIGRGYVHFALSEPGLFATAFDPAGRPSMPPFDPTTSPPVTASDLLTSGLEGLIAAGLLPAEEIEAARSLAWSAVHGLSWLLLGPMRGLPPEAQEAAINATLEQIGRGLVDLPGR